MCVCEKTTMYDDVLESSTKGKNFSVFLQQQQQAATVAQDVDVLRVSYMCERKSIEVQKNDVFETRLEI